MFYNGLHYNINNDEDYDKMKKGIHERRKELSVLQNKWLKTRKIIENIEHISNDITGAQLACEEYETKRNERKLEKDATIYSNKFNVAGTSFKKKQVGELINSIKEEDYPDLFEGYKNKEIEEYGATVFKYASFTSKKIEFEIESTNDFDQYAIKVIINSFHIGYVPKSLSMKIHTLIKNRDFVIKGIARIVGGPYKEFDYFEDKIVTKKLDLGINIEFIILDKK